MADEKNTSEVDDWLDDIEDGDVTSADLDQLDLDSLLDNDDESTDSTDGELDQSNIDALFDSVDSSPAAESVTKSDDDGELDQSNIDALLNSNNDDAPEQAASAPAESDDSGELDQSSIDDLFSSDSDKDNSPAQEAAPEESSADSGELDQSSIDDMFNSDSGEDDSPTQEAAPEESSADSGELDQSDIDDMFSSDSGEDDGPAQEAAPEESSTDSSEPDQSDLDEMFTSEDGDDDSPAPEAVEAAGADNAGDDSVKQEASEPETTADGEETPAGESFASELDDMEDFFSDLEDDDGAGGEEPFEAEDLDFSDMMDDSGEESLGIAAPLAAEPDETEESDATVGMAPEDVAEVVAAAQEEERQKTGFVLPFLPDSLNHTLVTGITLGLLVMLVGTWFFLRPGSEEIMPIAEQQPAAEEQPAANSIPVAVDGVYAMGDKAGELAITLAAEDSDSDPLTFEVTSPPLNGILSGNPPELTYLPNKTFSGEDHFEFKVSDGKEESGLATVVITGPNLVKLAEAEQQEKESKKENQVLRPKKPVIVAGDVNLRVISTDEAVIDWARIWRRANHTAFNDKIYIDIDKDGLRGELKRLNSGQSRYIPDKFFSGREIIRYRFKQGGISSTSGRIELRVALGTPPPEIRFKSLARNYYVGERVVIDAAPTRDEHRNSIKFSWEQLDGPPIRITPVNQEGSIISFVMPSTFSSQPGPCLRLTVVDDMGQSVSRELEMMAVSRRQTALWRGTGDGIAPDPEMDSRMLPWPY